MTPDQLIEHFGTQMAAAKAIERGQATISDWKTSGHIPIDAQIAIELRTKGALKADLPQSLRKQVA